MAAVGTSFDSGSVLADRFALSARLGTGATARVFLATDLRRQCPVAVKILHESLAGDTRFVRLFERESRLVASLQHDHVVTVIDAGSVDVGDLEVPYIVTEYMAGSSLAAMLDSGVTLDIAQVAALGVQAADALAYAHRRGVVHRDVKPSNLLFDPSGRLALADFGIARATAAASATEPSDTGVGAVRYASPEQVIGHSTDPKSDVYSLALVLIEAATGVVPLLGDSTVATMAARSRSVVEVPSELGILTDALSAATRLDVAERSDAAQLQADLAAARAALGEPEALPIAVSVRKEDDTAELLVDRTGGSVKIIGSVPVGAAGIERDPALNETALSETALSETARNDDVDLREFGRDSIAVADEYHALGASRPESVGPLDPNEFAAPGQVVTTGRRKTDRPGPVIEWDDGSGSPKRDRTSRGRRWLVVALVVALLVGVGGAAWWFLVRVPTHVVPNWVGAQVTEATAAAESNGWEVADPELVRRDGTTVGQVLEQDPVPDTELAEGEQMHFIVSEGPTLTDVPELANLTESDALAALDGAGLLPGARRTAYHEEVPAGAVISATAAGGAAVSATDPRVPKQTAVDYVVSDGPAPRVVPDGLVGTSLADAEAALGAVQLVADTSEEYSSEVPEGVVISVGIEPGTEVPRDSSVALVVSAGPEPIVVPDVVGMSGTAASAELENRGFTVSGVEGSPSGTVLATDPEAGESRLPGAAVRIFTRVG